MRVWIVEMLVSHERGSRWEPTVGIALSREDARRELEQWRYANPDDTFRLRIYRRKA